MFDVFQKGLIRGSEKLPFDPSKRYAYVEHPEEGWRVYLRSCIFLHPDYAPFNPQQFLVVKKTGSKWSSPTWEPPKGQMEGKDLKKKPILEHLKENVLREMEEESHITDVKVQYTGLVFQSREKDYPPNTYFQYHIFQGFVTFDQVEQSFNTFDWIKDHPKAFARWKRDRKEKDEVSWFNPRVTHLNPRWCPEIVVLYLRHVTP